jgi:hypothetical protein
MSSEYSFCTVRTTSRISTAMVRTEERCFCVNPKGDEEVESSMLRSAGKGRVEV